jgi:hypothetical protein
MFKTFNDENADKMRALAKAIGAPVAKFKSTVHTFSKAASGGIAANFFPSTPGEPRSLSTTELVENLGGAQNAARAKQGWKDALRAMFPTCPEMWNTPKPPQLVGGLLPTPSPLGASADRVSVGGASWPSGPESAPSTGKALGKSATTDAESLARWAALGESIVRLKALQQIKAAVDAGELDAKQVAAALAA